MKNTWPRAAIAIAEGQPARVAAERAEVSERTVRAWMADQPEFAQRVNDLRASMFEDASGRLSALTVTAVDELERLLTADGENVRLRAAQTVLDAAKSYRDHAWIESKIAELELAIRGKVGT